MKGKDTMKTAVWILAILLGLSPFMQAAETEKSPAILLQEAIYQEETEGDLDKAIELYGQVLEQAAEVERLAARATYQLGLCHLKKGNENKAAEYFRKVVSNYPKQTSIAKKAQVQLEKITPKKPKEFNQPVTVNVSQSPDGDRLTVQYAVMAIAKAAGMQYQWDKSQKLAGEKARQYIKPINFENTPANQAIISILEPVGLTYALDESGVFLVDIGEIVEKAILTISTCAEGDPRINKVMDPLKSLDETAVVKEVAQHLDSDENIIRRSAIYVLWRGEFSTIDSAVAKLEKLCSHTEDFTRGMAALALGQNKVMSSFDILEKMTLDDQSFYARRCGAYALGLMGDPKAKPILEKALNDSNKTVQENAKIALRMFELNLSAVAASPVETDKLKAENLVAEGWKLFGQGKFAEAEDTFSQAVRSDPENDGAYQGLGWAQMNQNKKKNAEVSFKKCVKLNPKNAAALNGLGWIAHGQDEKAQAIKWWEKAVEASNGMATASLSGLTQVYMEMEQYDKAVKYYEMWLKAEPGNSQAKEGLEKAKGLLK